VKKKIGVQLLVFCLIYSCVITGPLGFSKSPLHLQFLNTKTIYVDDDFIDDPENHKWNTIKEGITDARAGDTIYVFQGIYPEKVILDKTVTLIGENKDFTIIDAQNQGDCLHISSEQVNVTGFTLMNSGTEIYPQIDSGIEITSDYITISHCNIISNNRGILIKKSHNHISKCTISTNEVGIYVRGNNNTITNCEIINNSKGIGAEQVKDNNFTNLHVQNNQQGIHLVTSQYNSIKNSLITNNNHSGIILEWICDNNKISRCDLSNNGGDGIHVYASTDGNIITECQINNNGDDGIEFFDTVNNNTLLFCDIIGNNNHGIYSHWILTAPPNRMHYCNIYNNGFGVHGEQSQPIAIYNWWGSPDGPSGAGNGQGDEITDNVVHIPWLNEPSGENIPPTIDISSPLEGETVGNNIEIIGWTSDLDGLEDLRVVEIKINEGKWHVVNGTNPWRYHYNTLNNGFHIISARAYDYINYSELLLRTIIVDTLPPQVTLLYPKGGEKIKGTTTIHWEAFDNQDDNLEISLSYSPVGNTNWHTIMVNGENNGTYNWNISLLPNGDYILRISATDDAGNSAYEISGNFTIDRTFPTIKITKPRNGYLYIIDRELIPTLRGNTLIIGKITIDFSIDSALGIQKIELYLNDIVIDILHNPPYKFLLDEQLLGKHSLCVQVHDNENRFATHTIEPLFINL
jgi:parallel beta-helix repeat protein